MKKQFIFLVILSILIFGFAIPVVANTTDNKPQINSVDPRNNTDYYSIGFGCRTNEIDSGGKIYAGSEIRISGQYFLWGGFTQDQVKVYLNGKFLFSPPSTYKKILSSCIDLYLPQDIPVGSNYIELSNDSHIQSDKFSFEVSPKECKAYDWSCGNWSACASDSSQTRTCSKPSNCQGGVASPATSHACVYTVPQPSCTADTWTCGTWNSCSPTGIQSRSCTKTFDCPNAQTASPLTDQYCNPPNRPTQLLPQDSASVLNQTAIIKATVQLICIIDNNNAYEGSGTVIDPSGIILTNKHMVSGTVGCFVGFINNLNDTPHPENGQKADILKVSSTEDMAILKIRNPNNQQFPYINIKNGNSNINLGVKINVYGYPAKFGEDITYTNGVFSGTDGNYLKTTAILEHGNSGGGAYLNDGTFIGIPSKVVKGELNSISEILSLNTISSWLGNTSNLTYDNNASNNYSNVSAILEGVDLKKLGSLQSVVPGTNSANNSSGVVNPVFTRSLKMGMSGDDVKQLQTLLKKLNYFPSDQSITNYFGAITNAAVIKFQKDNNVSPAVGLFGPATQAKILSLSK